MTASSSEAGGGVSDATGAHTEEVRLAMAWNGGVSLAIWMGGVAVELDAARRAGGDRADGAHQALYAGICEAFDRRLVIDILCGASAGGLNGALLASAIQKGKALRPDFLRGRWLELGDFDLLMQPLGTEKAPSLMRGELFYEELKKTFRQLLGAEADDHSDLEPARVLLDVQVTDVEGEEHAFLDDWDATFYAREFRAPVRFRLSGHYSSGTLAAAARASASFPGAFESQRLTGVAARLAGFPDQTRWAIDGGLLENAPIRPAIELIPTRRAAGPVKRFVCYVNAHPSLHEETAEDLAQPELAQVLSYNVNLPRTARAIDQLYALDEAKRRGGLTGDAGIELLGVDPSALRETARALLPGYQRRRALLSLVELLEAPGAKSGPGIARQVLGSLKDPAKLPWIPGDLAPPRGATGWRWGIRAAQRILQLEIDVLRAVLADVRTGEDAEQIFRARGPIDDAIAELDGLHAEFVAPTGSVTAGAQRLRGTSKEREQALDGLAISTEGTSVELFTHLTSATRSFHGVMTTLTPPADAHAPAAGQLFGSAPSPGFGDAFTHFLGLGLAIEVIRRSFSDDLDIESGQDLHVAQLTPAAPTLLFTTRPLEEKGPCSPEDKLTGIRLAHFAAFYRSSWRANDFMWGRLDGASSVVRMLVDEKRAAAVERHSPTKPWTVLADMLVPAGEGPEAADQRELIRQALYPGQAPGAGAVGAAGAAPQLRASLEAALERDLARGDGSLTHAVCTRALQYAIFRDEAPHLHEQAQADAKLGAHASSLPGWDTKGPLLPLIQETGDFLGDRSLPSKLGRDDPDETTSPLALRTISRAAIVALAALRGVVPLARVLDPARVPLFALQGMTARRVLDRVAVVLGFTGAAWYLAARWLTIPAEPRDAVPLGALWSPQVLALWVCILAVAGAVAVPLVRAVRTDDRDRRLGQGLVALVIAAGGGALALGWQLATNGSAHALTAWKATYLPPTELLWLVAAAGGFQVASRLASLTRLARILHRPLGKVVSTTGLVVATIGGSLAALSMANAVGPALDDGGWDTALAVLAILSPIVLAGYLLSPRHETASGR